MCDLEINDQHDLQIDSLKMESDLLALTFTVRMHQLLMGYASMETIANSHGYNLICVSQFAFFVKHF